MPCQIFISYRRNGSDAHARVFYEKLTDAGYSVFLDFESIYSGGFRECIVNAIKECTDFILLIPKGGLKRCVDESDYMREEIVTAIKARKNIIPVFVDGFKMPAKDDLPDAISDIAEKNGIDCTMEYFSAVFDKLVRNLESQLEDHSLYSALSEVKTHIHKISHPYFRKWACIRLNEFLAENKDLFTGANKTNPHSEDTFGISGIHFTKKSLMAITSVADYWQDNFTKEYLAKQAELISKGVKIQRVFILEKGGFDKAKEQMEYQKSLGIDVYYIYKGDEYIDPDWLDEDYLIQDRELLVQIFCNTHQFTGQDRNTEVITMERAVIAQKIERFQRILERSERLVGDYFDFKN